jgi:polyisoprenyl-teichoic acid--peptidoglycan teichoic acid transferase
MRLNRWFYNLLAFLSAIAILVGCMPAAASGPGVSLVSYSLAAGATKLPMATIDPHPSTTPTPFRPVPPTASITPTLTPTITNTPRPTKTPETLLGGYKNIDDINVPDDQVRILIMGSDARPDGMIRTDVIMLLAVNPNGTASVISFPRDMWVYIPACGCENRINTAFQIGGFQGIADTLAHNFGVRPDYYMLTNFQGFVDIVNAIGGVTINATQEFEDACVLPYKHGICRVEVGETTLNGYEALWYVRSRKTTSDFDRQRRAQEVMAGLFRRLMRPKIIAKLPDLYDALVNNVSTDMSLEDMLPLLPLTPRLLKDGHVRQYVLGPGYVWDAIIGGAMVLVPNFSACRAALEEALNY